MDNEYIKENCVSCGNPINATCPQEYHTKHGNYCQACNVKVTWIVEAREKISSVKKLTHYNKDSRKAKRRLKTILDKLQERFNISPEEVAKSEKFYSKATTWLKH